MVFAMPALLVAVALAALTAASRTPTPVAPGVCEIVGQVEVRGDRAVIKFQMTLRVTTTRPRTVVRLGTAGAFVVGARLPQGGLPPLSGGPGGLTYLAVTPGEQTVILDAEARVGPRGVGRDEPGFEFGLPGAAITTLKLSWATPPGRVTVTPKVNGVTTATSEEPGALSAAGGYPLGPAESLEVSWAGANRAAPPSAEVDVSVRVEESAVETVAKFRLKGSPAEWRFLFPAGGDVVAERASGRPADAEAGAMPGLTRPMEKAHPVWTFRPPEAGGDWLLTATDRKPRPKPGELIRVGPVSVLGLDRQTGTLQVSAPPALRLSVSKSAAELRQLDPVPGDADNDANYRYTVTSGASGPFLELAAKSLPGFVRVQPRFTLKRGESGWQLTAEVHVTPVRMVVEELIVEIPAGYRGVEARGATVEDVAGAGAPGGRRLTVRLAGPQKAAFDLTLSANTPSPPTARDEVVPLMRFPTCEEEPGRVTVSVLEGLEVSGSVVAAGGESVSLVPEGRGPGPVRVAQATPDQPARSVEVSWHPYRPDLPAESRADISLTERQAIVTQRLRVRPGEGDARPVKLRGPAVGVRGLPEGVPLVPAGPGEWLAVLPAGSPPGSEVLIAVIYALPLPAGRMDGTPTRAPLPLLWPDSATQIEATVSVWGAGSLRAAVRAEGPWREVPPEPAPDHDALPWLTLVGSGPALPLTLELADADPAALAPSVERVLVQAWLRADVLAVRTRFALSRWSAAGALVEYTGDAPPEILVGERRVDPALISTELGESGKRIARLPLPDYKPGPGVLVVDVREVNPAGRAGLATIEPARMIHAPPRIAPRWRVGFPGELVPLDLAGMLTPDSRWVWWRGLLMPGAAESPATAAEWLAGAADSLPDSPDSPALALSARQTALGPVTLVFVPRGAAVGGVSALVVALGVILSRLPRGMLAVTLMLVGVAVVVGLVARPQMAAQALGAAEPGLAILGLGGAAIALHRAMQARRVHRLPGFTRVRPPMLAVPGSSPQLPRTATARPEIASAGNA